MRTFILGVGAQKAGTTCLFRQLAQHKNFIKGLVKEYHVFDATYLKFDTVDHDNIIRKIINFNKRQNDQEILKNYQTLKEFYSDTNKYFDYFDALLKKNTDFTTDITPSYAGLPSEAFAKIKKNFNQRGINVKVVFLMREPISRLESSIKMVYRRKGRLHNVQDDEIAKRMHKALNSSVDLTRANYQYTCQQLEQVFLPHEIFYGFYETLFFEKEINRLSHFLKVEPKSFDVAKVINASGKHFKYSVNDINQFKAKTEDRYKFVAEKFNFDLSLWDAAVIKMNAE